MIRFFPKPDLGVNVRVFGVYLGVCQLVLQLADFYIAGCPNSLWSNDQRIPLTIPPEPQSSFLFEPRVLEEETFHEGFHFV
jgi:hypothetical protein